jgi:protein-disulfide isomerase
MTDPILPDLEPGTADTTLDGPPPSLAPVEADVAPPESLPPVPPEPADRAERETRGSNPRRLAVLGFLGAVALGAVIGAAGLALARGGAGPTDPPAGATYGRPDAPVTIEVWADYQCPYCQLEDLLFGGAMDREYVTPGTARLVYRDFAFLGQESIDAAVAARCAGAQEPAAQLRFHDVLYVYQQGENQGRFARANLLKLAEIVGVPSQAAFTACLDDPAVATAVADETTAGRNVGVTSTPTIRLRGPGGERVLTGFSETWPTLRDAIEAVRLPAAPSPSGSGSSAPSGSAAPSPSGSSSPPASASASPSASP